MREAVDAALAAAFPERAVSSVSAASRSDRPQNETVRVTFADGDVAYLKVCADGDEYARERLVREVAALRYARRRADVRVPAVLAADPAGDPGFVATAALSGAAIASDWPAESTVARATVLRAVGRALAGVHAASFDGHAKIVGETGGGVDGDVVDTAENGGGDADEAIGLELETGPWSRVLAETLEARASELFADRFRDERSAVQAAVRGNAARLDGAPATLVHDDPRPENCLVGSDGPGLVDWETAVVGDPALDLVRAEAQYVECADVADADAGRLRRALRAGYRDRAGTLPVGFGDRRPIYRAVTFLSTARTFEHWAATAPEPVEELAGWVREELEARLDAIPDG